MPANHYEVLGVAATATPAELRQAYLDRARRLHPDRWQDASPRERDDAQRRMQEVNEAWRVLGDAARKRAYDAQQVGRPHAAGGTTTADGPRFRAADYDDAWAIDGGDLEPVPLAARLLRALPWVLVAMALVGIFVFTAYAGGPSGNNPNTGQPAVTRCAAIQPGGHSAVPSVCGLPNTVKVLSEVSGAQTCPEGSLVPRADATTAYCVDPSSPTTQR